MLSIRIVITLIVFVLSCLPCVASDIVLRWKANTETDLAGYKIYYKRNSSGAPYNGVDIDQGTSPIEIVIDVDYYRSGDNHYMDPDNPEFLLTGLDYDNYDYYLVITAFDNEEPVNESGYSNEVNTIDDSVDPLPSTGGGSSGGGCFISSTKVDKDIPIKIIVGLFALSLFALSVIGLDYMVRIINKLNSDLKTIIATGSTIILFIMINSNPLYKGIPILAIIALLLSILGFFVSMKEGYNMAIKRIKKC